MGFYHPSTLVKDAQRRGVRFHPVDVQISDWDCTVEPDGAIRLGLRYVNGLREQVGRAIASANPQSNPHAAIRTPQPSRTVVCPKCGCDDPSMLEPVDASKWFCNNCSHDWTPRHRAPRFTSIEQLVARTGLRRDELVTLADVGALNAFGYDRRSALWQAERAIRPSGELFQEEKTAEHAENAEMFLKIEDSATLGDLRGFFRRRGRVSAQADDRGRAAGRRLRRAWG